MKILVLLATVAMGIASPLSAGTLMFSGTFANTNPPAAPGGRCPSLTVSIGNYGPFYATGSSNLGAFTSVQTHCLDRGPPITVGSPDTPYYDGRFTYSFTGGDSLSGTYFGVLSNSGVAGVIDNLQNFLVTGGSGKFAHARGTFVGTGDIRFLGGPPTASLTIGESVLAVPEPATWGMLIIGFSATGLAAAPGAQPFGCTRRLEALGTGGVNHAAARQRLTLRGPDSGRSQAFRLPTSSLRSCGRTRAASKWRPDYVIGGIASVRFRHSRRIS